MVFDGQVGEGDEDVVAWRQRYGPDAVTVVWVVAGVTGTVDRPVGAVGQVPAAHWTRSGKTGQGDSDKCQKVKAIRPS